MTDLSAERTQQLAADITNYLREHNRHHAISNSPDGHVCGIHCVSESLAVWMGRLVAAAEQAAARKALLDAAAAVDRAVLRGHPFSWASFGAWLRDYDPEPEA